MSRAKLRRLKRASAVAGEQSFTLHNFVPDLPRAEDDALFARVPTTGIKLLRGDDASIIASAPARPLRVTR
jgi:hypothetical protein